MGRVQRAIQSAQTILTTGRITTPSCSTGMKTSAKPGSTCSVTTRALSRKPWFWSGEKRSLLASD